MLRRVAKALLAVVVLASASGVGWWFYRLQAKEQAVHTVGRGDVVCGVTVSGEVQCRQKTAVAAEIVALVRRLAVKEGQRVGRGDTLVELDDRVIAAECAKAAASLDRTRQHLAELKSGPRKEEILQARQGVKQAEAVLTYATKYHERAIPLSKRNAATQSELDLALSRRQVAEAGLQEAKAKLDLLLTGTRPEELARAEAEVRLAEAELTRCKETRRKYTLRAAHDAIVTAKYINPGEVVHPGQVLVRIDNINDVQVRARAQEAQMAGVRLGGSARVLADAYPDRPLQAKVVKILPRVDPESGSIVVLLELVEAPDVTLMDGMAVDVALIADERHGVTKIPSRAVERSDGEAVVWVRQGGSFQRRVIRTGLEDHQWVEVVDRLKPGDVIRDR